MMTDQERKKKKLRRQGSKRETYEKKPIYRIRSNLLTMAYPSTDPRFKEWEERDNERAWVKSGNILSPVEYKFCRK